MRFQIEFSVSSDNKISWRDINPEQNQLQVREQRWNTPE